MFLRWFRKTKPVVLGRWALHTEKEKLLRKIDLANCDSCCVCKGDFEIKPKEKPIIVILPENDVIKLSGGTDA